MSKKQQERKKKKREEIAKNRVLKRREFIRQEKKKSLMEQKLEKETNESVYGKQQPILNKDLSLSVSEEETNEMPEDVREKINHNMKILEALEEEYDKEVNQRKKINDKLEKEGHTTMKEKMDALHKKALEMEGKLEGMEQAQKEYEEAELKQAQEDYAELVSALEEENKNLDSSVVEAEAVETLEKDINISSKIEEMYKKAIESTD